MQSIIDKNAESVSESGTSLDENSLTLFGYNNLDFDDFQITVSLIGYKEFINLLMLVK